MLSFLGCGERLTYCQKLIVDKNVNSPEEKYLSSNYLQHNPTWDCEDSPWKAEIVKRILIKYNLKPASICEVGCGAGGVLSSLRTSFQSADLYGYDIAPDVEKFWQQHQGANINFYVGDFFSVNRQHYDVLMLLDVLEHVTDPFDFLTRLKEYADYFVFHIPLDLAALTVLREKPIINVRRKMGHIHYYTKGLALELLNECGYKVLEWQYTAAFRSSPKSSLRTRLAYVPRLIACAVNKDFGVRLFGGETLLILAKTSTD